MTTEYVALGRPERRQTHEAGYSWRKWTDPLADGRVNAANRGAARVRVWLFWLLCIDVGALAGLLVSR